jgi:anti-sigma factor ChrR (cupin superfamily)
MRFLRKLIALAAPEPAPIIGVVTETEEPATIAAAVSNAVDRRVEKDRVRAIMCSDEAIGRERLAQHLALATELAATDAIAILTTTPRESITAPAAVDATTSIKAARIRQAEAAFRLAFRGAGQSVPDAPDEPMSIIARIQANYAAAQGMPPRKST